MKRLINAFLSDMRYQWRYGFYLVYLFLVAGFTVLVRALPEGWRVTALAAVLVSDPALLGFFFIGGILQLERGEGLLDALFLSPMRPWEYIASKAASLGVISALAGCVIALASGVPVNYVLLVPAMLVGSACFTMLGVAVSVNLKSTNTFLSVDGLWEGILLLPPIFLLFGLNFLPLEILPASAVLRLVQSSLSGAAPLWPAACLLGWLMLTFLLADHRLKAALSRLGGAQ